MAKNKYTGYRPTDFAQQQENIRKAKGNPNKNIHRKKNGSNYGGGDYLARKEAQRRDRIEENRASIFDMSPTGKIIFGVLLVAAVSMMILSRTILKGSALAAYLPSLVLGLLSCFMAYVGYTNRAKRTNTFQVVLMVALAILGVVYTATGIAGLANVLGG